MPWRSGTSSRCGSSTPPEGPAAEHFTALAALEKALSDSGELDFFEAQNVIIVRDTTQVHETVQEIIRRLDVEPSQVFVDMKFVSTSNTDLLNLGVDYGDGGPQVSISGSQIPIALPFTIGDGGWEDDIIASDLGFGPFAGNSLQQPMPINPGQTQVPATLFGALWIGAVGGVIVVFTVPMLDKMKIDDVVGAIPVHLIAGIWGTNETLDTMTCAIITTKPHPDIAHIHDRMPVILSADAYEPWLDPATDADAALALLGQNRGSELVAYRVSTDVNSNRSQGSQLIDPIDA